MQTLAFTKNRKTILSVDFDRRNTCPQFCAYCYVDNMENIYPSYLAKIQKNNSWAKDNADKFARQLNNEYRKLRKSKAKDVQGLEKLPVRIYGSGDYIPEHYAFLSKLDFKFYIISKSLTAESFKEDKEKLLQLENLTRIVLSFDNQNVKNYDDVKQHYKKDRFQFAFTGTPLDWQIQTEHLDRKFGIFFNISNKKVDKEFSKSVSQSCPTDGGKLPLSKACSICPKCWKSSRTKDIL